jgi:GNAT superfamily N-acetyltransferase
VATAPSATVTVWHLAMDRPEELRAARPSAATLAVEDDPALNHALYEELGAEHHWADLRGRDEGWWRARLRGRTTLVARVGGEVAGYAELAPAEDGGVEVAYLGVRREHRGRGIGGHLLSEAVAHAWRGGAARVTVETCSLDGPGALPGYRARGFRVVREARERRPLVPGP